MYNFCIIGHYLFHFAEELNREASKFRKMAKKLRKKVQLKNFKVS